MALFTKEDRTHKVVEDDFKSPVTPTATVDPTPPRDVQTSLGKGSRIEGKLTFEGSVRIDGQIEGDITAQETVTIGKNAEVTAQIHAAIVIVEGRVNGDITARQRVELRAPAKLVGNVSTPSLIIHEGAMFEGSCTMGDENRAEKGDKKIAIFPTEERNAAARRPSEAAS